MSQGCGGFAENEDRKEAEGVVSAESWPGRSAVRVEDGAGDIDRIVQSTVRVLVLCIVMFRFVLMDWNRGMGRRVLTVTRWSRWRRRVL